MTHPQQVWLIAQEMDPAQGCWIAVNPEANPTPLRLVTPSGTITADEWRMGRIEWRAPVGGEQVVITKAQRAPIGLRVPEGVQVRLQEP